MTLLKGKCEILGYPLPIMQPTKVTSCTWTPAYPMVFEFHKKKTKNMTEKLKKLIPEDEMEKMNRTNIESLDNYDCILLIESFEESEMEWLLQIERFSSCFHDMVQPLPSDMHTLHSNLKIVNRHSCLVFHQSSDCSMEKLEFPITWKRTVSVISSLLETNPRVMVCGGKGVGKSTFLRYLLNSTLQKCKYIAVLDCDLGQPEYTVPGIISLHILSSQDMSLQPIHLNMRQPYTSFFIGDVVSKNQPHLVIQAIQQLLPLYLDLCEKAKENDETRSSKDPNSRNSFGMLERDHPKKKTAFPLFVNLDGWIKGMGEEMLSSFIPIVHPSIVVYIRGLKHNEVEPLSRLPKGCTLMEVDPGTVMPSKIHGVDLRNLRCDIILVVLFWLNIV